MGNLHNDKPRRWVIKIYKFGAWPNIGDTHTHTYILYIEMSV